MRNFRKITKTYWCSCLQPWQKGQRLVECGEWTMLSSLDMVLPSRVLPMLCRESFSLVVLPSTETENRCVCEACSQAPTYLTKDVFLHRLGKGKHDVNAAWPGITEHWKSCAYSWLLHPRLGSWNTRNDFSMLCIGRMPLQPLSLQCNVVIAVYMCTQLSWMEPIQEVWCLPGSTHTGFSLHFCYSYFSTYLEE